MGKGQEGGRLEGKGAKRLNGKGARELGIRNAELKKQFRIREAILPSCRLAILPSLVISSIGYKRFERILRGRK